MGSGKSTMAINHINANKNKKFLCIVPLLDECNRYKKYTKINIVDPKNWGSKWKQFRCLVEDDMNIVTTHALIQKMDLDMLELLKSKDYTLMIDECLDVIDTYKISKDDLKALAKEIVQTEAVSICWAMGVTQHRVGSDTSTAISNLLLVTGNYMRPGTGAYPLRGHNNVQGCSDMGSMPNTLPGYQDVTDAKIRQPFEKAWNVELDSEVGLDNHEMIDSIHEGTLH